MPRSCCDRIPVFFLLEIIAFKDYFFFGIMDDVMNHFDINLICSTANNERYGIHSQFAGWINNNMRLTCVELLSVGCIGVYYLHAMLIARARWFVSKSSLLLWFACKVQRSHSSQTLYWSIYCVFSDCIIFSSRIITHVFGVRWSRYLFGAAVRAAVLCEFLFGRNNKYIICSHQSNDSLKSYKSVGEVSK